MAAKKGICAICGRGRKLSFEHLPPECAFNEHGATVLTFEDWQKQGSPMASSELVGGRPVPKGTGYVTLCERCNNFVTGTQYVPAYCDWVKRCAAALHQVGSLEEIDARAELTTVELRISDIYPLRVVKEVVANMLALNAEGNPQFRTRHPDLVDFVLDRDRCGLPDRYHVYAVLYAGPFARFVPTSITPSGHRITALEHPPVAHVLTVDEERPFLPIGEITNFADSPYDQRANWTGELLVGFGHLGYPGDYRPAGKIKVEGRDETVVHIDDPGGEFGV